MVDLRGLPSVDQLLQTSLANQLIQSHGRPLTVEGIRAALADARTQALKGGSLPSAEDLLKSTAVKLDEWVAPALTAVINATGVLLHTNLGRAPLSPEACEAARNAAEGYSTLEYDLEKGERGSRGLGVEAILKRITGAEAALVVNNNAAALLLVLSALARRKRTVIARSQLVEIGGGFRIPDVMAQSGAKLVEVGTTNRVHPEDYARGLEEPAALVLHAHSSNYRIIGFTSEVELDELVKIAHDQHVPVVDDLGSGALIDTAQFGLAHEPTVAESLSAGVDLVCFSGDKLLGGPQAGIILGKKDYVARVRKHPLARAVRADKLCLAALHATLTHYLKDEIEAKLPVYRMLSQSLDDLDRRARVWADVLGEGEVRDGRSTVGGGSLPGETLPTRVLVLEVSQPNRFLANLRAASPPIIARIEDDRVVLDPRSVLPEQDGAMLMGLRTTLEKSKTRSLR